MNLVLNGVSQYGGESFGGKTYINGEILNSNYIAGNYHPLKINTHASNLILSPDNGGNIVIKPESTHPPSGILPGEVQLFLGGDPLGSGASGGGSGYIKCEYASNPAAGSTGPTNIVNRNHNGYIGTHNLLPSKGTGLRGYSCIATTFAAAAKLYIAPNLATAADGSFVSASSIEGPQGVILLRGQIQLTGQVGEIDIDLATASPPNGSMIIPHNFPVTGWQVGTFGAMYQNPMVTVTNGGVISGTPAVPPAIPNYSIDPQFTKVQAVITLTGVANAQVAKLHIESDPTGTHDLVVNYVIYAERCDKFYLDSNNTYVKPYNNPVTGTTHTWSGSAEVAQLNKQYGADYGNWE